ncbi:hypothetical protein [Xanthomonas sp. F1]
MAAKAADLVRTVGADGPAWACVGAQAPNVIAPLLDALARGRPRVRVHTLAHVAFSIARAVRRNAAPMHLHLLLLLLAQLRRPHVVAGAAQVPLGPPPSQRNTDMPTATPLPLIKPANWLFSSIDIDEQNNVFSPRQFPSTYYMDENGAFIRLRPLHKSGFGIFKDSSCAVALYTGEWNDRESFSQNLAYNNDVLGYPLGTTAQQIAARIAALQANPQSFQDILNHNNAPNANRLDRVVCMVGDGPLAGTVWGGDVARTRNMFVPMDVVDAVDPDSRHAHTGHSFIAREGARLFYDSQHPGVLEHLWLLGQSRQSFTIDLAPKGRAHSMVVRSDLEYFAQSMFEDRDEQLAFLRSLYMSFV